MPCYRAEEIVSATGSGDCSIAGFLVGYLKGESPERAGAIATAVGCQNLAALGATDGVKDWEHTLAMVNDEAFPRLPFELKSPAWHFNETKQIWIGPKDTV